MYNPEEQKALSFWDKIDTPLVGFVIGWMVPAITFIVLYLTQYKHLEFGYFLEISSMKNTAPILLRTMVFPNLPIFLVANIFKKFMICRGIFISSILIILAMLIIKYL